MNPPSADTPGPFQIYLNKVKPIIVAANESGSQTLTDLDTYEIARGMWKTESNNIKSLFVRESKKIREEFQATQSRIQGGDSEPGRVLKGVLEARRQHKQEAPRSRSGTPQVVAGSRNVPLPQDIHNQAFAGRFSVAGSSRQSHAPNYVGGNHTVSHSSADPRHHHQDPVMTSRPNSSLSRSASSSQVHRTHSSQFRPQNNTTPVGLAGPNPKNTSRKDDVRTPIRDRVVGHRTWGLIQALNDVLDYHKCAGALEKDCRIFDSIMDEQYVLKDVTEVLLALQHHYETLRFMSRA